jgi:hypothetical protein
MFFDSIPIGTPQDRLRPEVLALDLKGAEDGTNLIKLFQPLIYALEQQDLLLLLRHPSPIFRVKPLKEALKSHYIYYIELGLNCLPKAICHHSHCFVI